MRNLNCQAAKNGPTIIAKLQPGTRYRFTFAVIGTAICLAFVQAAMSGCFEADISQYAVLDDISANRGRDSGCRLVAVDGHPVTRIRGRFVDLVPYALGMPGDRALTIKFKTDAIETEATVIAKLQPGTRYRFAQEGGRFLVVKDSGPEHGDAKVDVAPNLESRYGQP